MDGTINLGNTIIDGALDMFRYLKDNNIRYVFFTNNSSHDLVFYEKKMRNFGIDCNIKDNFYSSTEVTIDYLKQNGYKTVFVIGNKCLRDSLSRYFSVINRYDPNVAVDAVVAGFSTELVYEELKSAVMYLQKTSAPFIATNGDYRCPIEGGLFIPDCGSMCEVIRLCTGKSAKFLGKPNPEIIDYLGDRFKVKKEEMMVVGDRLYTDILVGVNSCIDSICVLTGECTKEDIEKSEYKPTYVLKSVKEIPNLLKSI